MEGLKYNSGSQRSKLVINLFACCVMLYFAVQRSVVIRDQSPFESWVIDIIAPVQRAITNASNSVEDFYTNYFLNVGAIKKSKELQFTITEMESRVFELEQLLETARSQSALINIHDGIKRPKIVAQVISVDSSKLNKMIRLNKGKNHGVALQSAVVTSRGVVGFVYRLSDNFSDVLTILDSKSKVDGFIARTGSHGIIEGNLQGQAKMKYVKRRDPVVLDDMIITSGLGNIYPRGLKVGTITEIQRQSYGISQNILIMPSVDFSKLSDVLILAPKHSLAQRAELLEFDSKGDQ